MNRDKYWSALAAETDRLGGNGGAVAEALADLYTVYEKGLYLWLARLYDAETGGFYYSNSARDNEGFLPDIESTLQAVNILCRSGLFADRDALPEKMKQQIGAFLLARFDPADGYFYHPQWAKNICDSRRGRDLMWAESLCKSFKVPLGAPTATARLQAMAQAASDKTSDAAQNLPEYLQSKDNFMKYLKSLNWETGSYGSGNQIVAQSNQIIAAGYAEDAVRFLNSVQNPETGFWGNATGYNAINGFLKITSFYVDAGAPVNYALKAAQAAAECLTVPDIPETVCWQYNVWFSLGNLLELFGKLSGVMDPAEAKQVHALLLRLAPEAIRATKEKVLLFKKPDASFSYLKNETSWVSQNAPVAVRGTNEGDVNATIICSAEILHKIYRALGMVDFMVPLYDETDTKEFLTELKL